MFMNVTLYKEVISKPSVSQYVLISPARAGRVHSNKYLWKLIITRREYIRRQRANTEKQKESDLEWKLVQMQKPTSAQIDEKVDEKIAQTVPGSVRAILDKDLDVKAFEKNKRQRSLNTSSGPDGMKNTKSVQKENNNANTNTNVQPAIPIMATTPQPIPQMMQANQRCTERPAWFGSYRAFGL